MIKEIGISSCGLFNINLGGLLELHSEGIKYFELSTDASVYEIIDYKLLKHNADIAGVTPRSIHLPFQPFTHNDPSSLDEKIRVATVKLQTRILGFAKDAGFKIAVIHPSGEPISEEDREKRMAQAKKTLKELADVAEKCGMVIAVENLPRTCLGRNSSDILELISADDRLRVCYDTNHLLEEDALDFIKACGDKIVTLHVSDYDFLDERHWLPGEGQNDWQKIYNALSDTGYDGPWMYEVSRRTPASIKRTKKYLEISDFATNAKEIFENKPLTVIGTPKENLPHWKNR